jgi:hypothetical protein
MTYKKTTKTGCAQAKPRQQQRMSGKQRLYIDRFYPPLSISICSMDGCCFNIIILDDDDVIQMACLASILHW